MMSQAEMRALSNRLLNTANTDIIRPCTVEHETQGEYDPSIGGPAPPTVTSDFGNVLFTNGILAKRQVEGREVEPNAQGAYGAGFTTIYPEEGDRLIVDGRNWRVADSDDVLLARALWEFVLVPE